MISFDNTEIAFRSKNKQDLQRAYWLFKIIGAPSIVKIGKLLTPLALRLKLPIKGVIKKTIFKQFCGGESIQECDHAIEQLAAFGIGTILDYSVEGKTQEDDFEKTTQIIIETIEKSATDKHIPFAVFKITGIAQHHLLELVSSQLRATRKGENFREFTPSEKAGISAILERIDRICAAAARHQTRLFIDAEETWIQTAIDQWTFDMMCKYNQTHCIVYNTIQMYRHDRLAYLRTELERAKNAGIKYGVKLVRGAYMEKERARAQAMGYPSPIQPDKASTDKDYDAALDFLVANRAVFSVCAGTHNENSSMYLATLLHKEQVAPNDPKFYFAQLLGMSDHISYNLSDAGYQVAKYVPFGPVQEVLPYLLRRADENTSVAGQTSRELGLIIKERARRKQLNA
ncbi:MAG: proline dehydrogenase family protein [Cryomorphaceae bacterium]|nr:proline dehydrogenase family protein [Cryomorphaceae bacterium]